MEAKNFDLEDLICLEKDLTTEELVSVLFLLYGSEKPQWILEKIENSLSNNLLHDYATHTTNWKTRIIEALTITRSFEVINKLGIKSSEAREHLRKSTSVNPGLKLLYQFCETCTKSTTDKLVNKIKEDCSQALKSNGILEIFFLHAISCNLIKVGQSLDDCDFSFITNFFAKNKCDEVEFILRDFPKRSNLLDNANTSNSGSFHMVNLATSLEPKSSKILNDYPSRNMQVLIINQQNFYRETNPELVQMLPDHELSERKGTERDRDALKLLFEDFGYQVTVLNNLKHVEILKEIEKATRKASLVNGIIVCVLSHGHEGIVYGSNSIPVRIKDIKKIMASKVLLGKSKIFLIQACQGENLQKSVKKVAPRTEFDGPSQSSLISGSIFADFLTFWSTIEGFASVRHIDNGSWFIQELVGKIRQFYRDQHLMDICTNVINEVSLKRGYRDECMLPKLETTFTRNFRFPEAKNHSSC